jgi:zinc/manganese transport system ATP-binding protein/zinc transport system ATP-binding protein
MDPLVELNHVTFGYGAEPVVEDVQLHLHPGQFAAVIGPSGAGKTTLLRLILGALQPQRGEVCIHGRALNGRLAPYVAYVPQLETVDWTFPVTAEQAVLMGRVEKTSAWPWPSAADRRAVRAVMGRLGIGELASRSIGDLSGGQRQRVFLARALVAEPDLLVLDEPTAGVDMHTAEEILHLLADLNAQGMTIMISTHDLNLAGAHVPWVVCLNRRVIAQGPPEVVYTPDVLSATYRGEMLVLRQDGLLLVHQKAHGHGYQAVVRQPVVGGHTPDEG